MADEKLQTLIDSAQPYPDDEFDLMVAYDKQVKNVLLLLADGGNPSTLIRDIIVESVRIDKSMGKEDDLFKWYRHDDFTKAMKLAAEETGVKIDKQSSLRTALPGLVAGYLGIEQYLNNEELTLDMVHDFFHIIATIALAHIKLAGLDFDSLIDGSLYAN